MPKGSYLRTKEIKKKMSLSHLGKKQLKETVNKRVKFLLGNTFTKGKKYPDRKRPKPFTDEHKKNLSSSHKGKSSTWMKGKPAWNKGKKFPELSGENSPNWIKDRTKLKKSADKMNDYAYKVWMLKVKKRDNWKCRLANSDCNGRLESHHILNWEDNPELRYITNNGITLCHAHHPRGRANEKRLEPILMELVSVSGELI